MGYEALINDETIGPTVLKIALAIQAEAANAVPVKSGNLRNSISVAMKGFYKSEGSTEKLISSPNEDQAAHVGSAVEYALAVEYGLPEKQGYPMQPYMRPARDQVYSQIGKISAKELAENLERYANRHPHVKVMEAK
jgi:hypothetical protein